MPIQTFGLRLRHARKELRKMRQEDLAKAAGIKQPSLSELETGETKEVSGPVLVSLSKALRVRPEWLVTGELPIEPNAEALSEDERELLERYREASGRWKIAVRYMAGLRHDAQQEEAATYLMSKIFATPVPDARVAAAFGPAPHTVQERTPLYSTRTKKTTQQDEKKKSKS